MTSNHFDEHPLAHLVAELVLDYLPHKHLLPCRLVNHTWNEVAVRLLSREGWALKLDNQNVGKYLGLLKVCCPNGKAYLMKPLPLNLEAKIRESIWWPPPLVSSQALSFGLPLPSPWPSSSLTSLKFFVDGCGNEVDLLEILRLNALTLAHVEVNISVHSSGRGFISTLTAMIQRFLNSIKMKNSADMTEKGLTFSLPKLKSLHIELVAGEYDILPPVLASMARGIVTAAPNLESLAVEGYSSWYLVGPTLLDIYNSDQHKFSHLLELGLRIANFASLESLFAPLSVQFTRLRKLSIHCFGLSMLISIVQFVHSKCPSLVWLEVTEEVAYSWFFREEILALFTLEGLTTSTGALELPNLVHFGCTVEENLPLTSVGHLLAVMRGFPSLVNVNTDLKSYLRQLCPWDSEEDGSADEEEERDDLKKRFELHRSKWHSVKTMQLAVKLLQGFWFSWIYPDTLVLPRGVAHVIGQLYPNIEQLVIKLDGLLDTWAYKRIEYFSESLLTIAAELPGLKQLEINEDDYQVPLKGNKFLCTQLLKGGGGSGSNLDIITIRERKKRSANRDGGASGYIRSSDLIEMFSHFTPEITSPLLIRIDADLLCPEDHNLADELDQLDELVEDTRNPNIRVVLL